LADWCLAARLERRGVVCPGSAALEVVTKHNKLVAVLMWVTPEHYARREVTVKSVAQRIYSQVLELGASIAPQDDTGFAESKSPARQPAWQRANAFAGLM